jgi:CBS domain-containing protein
VTVPPDVGAIERARPSAPTVVARDRMTRCPITVPGDATFDQIAHLFDVREISAAPVTADGRLVGLVSSTDLVRALSRPDPRTLTARELMSSPALVARPDESVDAIARRLVAGRVHRLVVAVDDRPVGIVSTRDLYEDLQTRRSTVKLGEIMSTPVKAVDVGDPIERATALLTAENVHGLVVLELEAPVGVYTHREAIAACTESTDLRRRQVEELMSHETICLDVDTPIFRAAAHAQAMSVRRLFVVERRRLVGMVTSLDLANVLAFSGP